jgi:hypothetical protein
VAFFLSSAFSCINSRTWPSHHKASSLQISCTYGNDCGTVGLLHLCLNFVLASFIMRWRFLDSHENYWFFLHWCLQFGNTHGLKCHLTSIFAIVVLWHRSGITLRTAVVWGFQYITQCDNVPWIYGNVGTLWGRRRYMLLICSISILWNVQKNGRGV